MGEDKMYINTSYNTYYEAKEILLDLRRDGWIS
jgi:hypothetical protein